MKNILITETDRIGDVILSLPVYKSIKLNKGKTKIVALVRNYTKDIFKDFKYVDDVMSFSHLDNKEEKNRLIEGIKEQNFDTALLLHPNYTLAQIIHRSGIPDIFSYGWKWYQYLFTQVIIQHRSKNLKHQLEYNLDLLKLLKINKGVLDIRLKSNAQDLKFINDFLNKKNLLKKTLIGIHPGSGHSSLNLPPHQYVELIEKIKRKFNKTQILITGTEQDKGIIEYIAYNTKVALNPMPLNLSLGQLIALISKMKLFISNSTGPMHIASALRIPVVAFFSPVFIHSPIRWGPYWGNKLVIKPEIECKQYWHCVLKKCKDYNCFNRISYKKVLDFIQKYI